MVKSLHDITEYLLVNAFDPFPRFILKKEILKETISGTDIDAIQSSKWYGQLADEQ